MISHYIFHVASRQRPVRWTSKCFMILELLKMQKRPSISEAKEEISDIQNDPLLQKLFEDAVEVLRLAGADEKATVEYPRSDVSHQATRQQVLRREKKQIKHSNGKQAKKPAAITKSKRRKLERIKAPVTILRKRKQDEVPSEEEQETTVQRMLNYVDQMPSQEIFHPPALPFVSFTLDKDVFTKQEYENAANDNPPYSTESIQDYTYLSNEKDVALWKMLVASPTNCNVFVGGLGHGVTSEILHTAFEAFSLKEDDKPHIKTHVVMDVARSQSKGYGFVSFPCRRSAELAMICMQDFEIYGRAMQLGWGQENRDEQPSGIEECQETKKGQHLHEMESPTLVSIKPKGGIVSDTVFYHGVDSASKQPLKRCSSRWDQEAPKKYQRIEESVGPDHTHGDTNQKNREDRFLSEECHPVLLLNSQLKDSNSGQEERSTSDETGLESISKEISLDVKVTQFDKEGFSSSSGEGQDPNRFVTEIEKEVNTRRSSADEQKIFREASSSGDQNPRKAIQWLTHGQKVALMKSVCSKLRDFGVRGHLGVFGVHYEADNSRLYVVCAKHVTEAQLLDEFKVFGTADVKLNKDVNGFSKGCAFVQYTDSTRAERAIKQLHGKVVGGMPMKVMVAEPKVRKGSRGKQTVL